MPKTKSPVAVSTWPPPSADAVEAVLGVADDVVGVVVAGEQERVGHAHHRQVLVRLAPAVAAARAPVLAGAHEVPHVVGEHAVLDEHVALRGRALVVDRVRAPLACVRAVVDQRDQRRRDELADVAAEHRRVLVDEIGFEPVTARLVEQHATRAALQHDRQLPAGRRTGAQHRERPLGRGAGDLLRVDLVEDLEPERAARAPRCRSACRCRRPPRS